jgi:hypothetical protein
MLKEVLILINEALDEQGCFFLNWKIFLKDLLANLTQELLSANDLMNIFIVFTGFSDQMIDCFSI